MATNSAAYQSLRRALHKRPRCYDGRVPPKPRKRPRQARSAATVDAIVEATGHVLARHGLAKSTTARIARRAGVSVGSLYQYFPGKESLVAAFIERRLEHDLAVMRAVVEGGAPHPPRELFGIACRELVRLIREERDLYREIIEVVPMVDQVEELRAGLSQAVELAAELLRASELLPPGRDPKLAALMAMHAVRSALLAVLVDAPEHLDDPALADMLVGCALGLISESPTELGA